MEIVKRDFNKIRSELILQIGQLTNSWAKFDDNDIGHAL